MNKQVKLRWKIISRRISKSHISIKMIAYLENKNRLKIGKTRFYIDDDSFVECKLAESCGVLPFPKRIKEIHTFNFGLDELLAQNSRINGTVRFEIEIEGQKETYYIKEKRKHKTNKFYYLPEDGVYHNGFEIHFRHSYNAALVSVKRKMEKIEYNPFFRFVESKPVSALLYLLGTVRIAVRHKKINVFYEKFSMKAEEGTYELFEMCRDGGNSLNFYIVNENSVDFERLKNNKNVIRQYSWKYYWIIFSANAFISTETPDGHVSVLRSKNWFLMRRMYESKFIFLQHGVTYMKRHGRTSSFLKGKGGEPDLMVVGSQKEKNICKEMLNLDESVFLVTGLPIYGLIDYKHISQQSDDYVMVMLTWKPYEEHLYDFTESEYYRNVIGIAEILKRHIDDRNVIFVGHPKINHLLKKSELNINLWEKPISEALKKAKLLITDYSSVCYNSFYQGAGVIFYQPDLTKYEEQVGPLIPSEDEYIGNRVFNIKDLETLISKSIHDGSIDLSKVRNDEFEKIHHTINSFTDGKNIDRIYRELLNRKIV